VRSFWPIGEGAQADYEQLRAGVLAGTPLVGAAAGRFARLGLAGLILAPAAPAVFSAVLVGAARPSWSPYADPRHEALGEGYLLVLNGVTAGPVGTRALAASGRGPS
jgi:hypothetical protein